MKACLPSNQCTVPENTKLLQEIEKFFEYFWFFIGILLPSDHGSIMIIIKVKYYGGLLSFGIRPLIGLLYINTPCLISTEAMGVKSICNKARYTLTLVSKHFFIACFLNSLHTSVTCHSWVYDDDMV